MVFFKFLMPSPCAVARLSARSASNPKSVRCARPIGLESTNRLYHPLPSLHRKEKETFGFVSSQATTTTNIPGLIVVAYPPGNRIHPFCRFLKCQGLKPSVVAILLSPVA
ncbi:hypothetical protein PGTUg99_017811 [Puccinia graminis f. sp. tritici]|uniref:Uncharacterized protein n=1 Tax=Puccinia graminis f. sp. tritici TaxID=56615 RepID=A0A5B0RHY5_PUCGR|nr:hypothetical protein PGTUg99_017811 [Puccinia graminis f. sp. tritici]